MDKLKLLAIAWLIFIWAVIFVYSPIVALAIVALFLTIGSIAYIFYTIE